VRLSKALCVVVGDVLASTGSHASLDALFESAGAPGAHAKRIGDELIIDPEHYRRHPDCKRLWCVIYDPDQLITNAQGLKDDLEGSRSSNDAQVVVKVFVL